MVERLTDEQVADLTGHWDWKMTNLAREVQQQRTLIPEVIEQLAPIKEKLWRGAVGRSTQPLIDVEDIVDGIIAKLRGAIQ